MSFPDAQTRLCGVVGHPVGHSLSPAIHNAALRHDGRNAVYVAFDVLDFDAAIRGLSAVGAVGVNITVPHKHAAFEIADRRSEDAFKARAANTLVFGPEGIDAHNTDIDAVGRALAELGSEVSGARCVVIGAGGAGRAAVLALTKAGASDVAWSNRTDSRIADLGGSGFPARPVPWAELDGALEGAEIVVHATSVGLDGTPSFISDEVLDRLATGGCRGVLDLVYAPGETDLVNRARRAGIASADGLGVLVHQAAAAYGLFWDSPAPTDLMREAASKAAGRRPGVIASDPPPVV